MHGMESTVSLCPLTPEMQPLSLQNGDATDISDPHKRFDDITSGFPRVTRCIDDSLLWDDDIATFFWHTLSYINLCAKNGIMTKFRFAENTIEFSGFDITDLQQDSFSPIRTFRGLQTSVVCDPYASLTHSPRHQSWPHSANILEKQKPFSWDDTLETIYQNSKKEIISSIEHGVTT